MESKQIFQGIFPVAPTPFLENQDIDILSQQRVLDCMIDQGVDGICILANYSEQFLLSDKERDTLIDTCLDHIAGRVPVIVTCSHYCTQIVINRATRAQDKGASMVMLMPPYHGGLLKADERSTYDQFQQVSDKINIPIMVQDAPISGVTLSVGFLAKLAKEIENVSYFKIEVQGAANKLHALIETGGESIIGPFDGEESITLLPDLEAGAVGTMPSAMYPDIIKPVIDLYFNKNYSAASDQYNKILPLINFENRQCGLQGTKIIMKEGGVIKSDIVRHPLNSVSQANRNGILKLAKEHEILALKWGKN